jgi:hypothetical protein
LGLAAGSSVIGIPFLGSTFEHLRVVGIHCRLQAARHASRICSAFECCCSHIGR